MNLQNVLKHHTIIPDGCNMGQDKLVNFAVSGTRSFDGVKYASTVKRVIGLLLVGTQGVNHGSSSSWVSENNDSSQRVVFPSFSIRVFTNNFSDFIKLHKVKKTGKDLQYRNLES